MATAAGAIVGAGAFWIIGLGVQALIGIAYPEQYSLGEGIRNASQFLPWIFAAGGAVAGGLAGATLAESR